MKAQSQYIRLPGSKSISTDLIGKWRPTTANKNLPFHLDASGNLSVYHFPKKYEIRLDNLTLPGQSFDRIGGTSGSLIGVWRDRNTAEEITFRQDMSLSLYVPASENEPSEFHGGFYRVFSAPDRVQLFEYRGVVDELNYTLTFNLYWGVVVKYTYTLSSKLLTLTTSDGEANIFEYDGP